MTCSMNHVQKKKVYKKNKKNGTEKKNKKDEKVLQILRHLTSFTELSLFLCVCGVVVSNL